MVVSASSLQHQFHPHAAPLQAASRDTVDSGAVEQLLSEKLVQGYLLLEKACPSCATPLVKQQATAATSSGMDPAMSSLASSAVKGNSSSNNNNNNTSAAAVIPIAGVPFCVWCQAHVVTDDTEVRQLESASSRLGDRRGTIMAVAAAASRDDDPTTEHPADTYDDEYDEDDQTKSGTYRHLATLDLTTPKPYDEKSYSNNNKIGSNSFPQEKVIATGEREPTQDEPVTTEAATTTKAASTGVPASKTLTSLFDTATDHVDTPHPTNNKSFGTFMSSIFGGAASKATAMTSQQQTTTTMQDHFEDSMLAFGSVASDKATTASSDHGRQHDKDAADDKIAANRRKFDFDVAGQSPRSNERCGGPGGGSTTTSRSRGSKATSSDDCSTDDYEEIEVVHVDDDNQTTLSELEEKILNSDQVQQQLQQMEQSHNNVESVAYNQNNQSGFERIQMLLSEESDNQYMQQPQYPLLSADASSITASIMTSQQQQQLTSQTTGASQIDKVKEGQDAEEPLCDKEVADETVNIENAVKRAASVDEAASMDAPDDVGGDVDDGSKCTVSIEHHLDMVELAHISEDDEETLPTYDERRDIATKVLGAKMIQGFKLTELQCNKCLMPLMAKNSSYFCVVCPVLKKKFKESLASLGDDLTEASHKSRMQSGASGSRIHCSSSSSNKQTNASKSSIHSSTSVPQAAENGTSDKPSKNIDGDALAHSKPPEEVSQAAESLKTTEESGVAAASLDRTPYVSSWHHARQGANQEQSAQSAALTTSKPMSGGNCTSQRESALEKPTTCKPIPVSAKKVPTRDDRMIQLRANVRDSVDHSVSQDIQTALSPKSIVSKLTSVGSASQYGRSLAPAMVPKTVSAPTTTLEPATHVQDGAKPNSGKSMRYLTPTKDSKIPWEHLKLSASPVQSQSDSAKKQHETLAGTAGSATRNFASGPKASTLSAIAASNKAKAPAPAKELINVDVSQHTELQLQLPVPSNRSLRSLSHPPNIQSLDNFGTRGLAYDAQADSDLQLHDVNFNDARARPRKPKQNAGLWSESDLKQMQYSCSSEKSYDTVPEHLLELRKMNQSAEASGKRPDAPANTLVRSVKSGIILPTPFSEDALDTAPLPISAVESPRSPLVQVDEKTEVDAGSTYDLSVDKSVPTKEFSVELPQQKNLPVLIQEPDKQEDDVHLIAAKAAKEMKKRKGIQFISAQSRSTDEGSGKRQPIDASVYSSSSQSQNIESFCVSLLSDDIKAMQMAAATAMRKTDKDVSPCIQEAIQLVVNPFAQLEDGYNDFLSLSPPSRQKRKEIDMEAAALLAEAEAAESIVVASNSSGERQDQIETALSHERQRVVHESKRVEQLERQYNLRRPKHPLLDGLTNHMKKIFGDKERDLLQDISTSVKAREEAEAEALRLTQELHALKEQRLLDKLQEEADERQKEAAVAVEDAQAMAKMLADERDAITVEKSTVHSVSVGLACEPDPGKNTAPFLDVAASTGKHKTPLIPKVASFTIAQSSQFDAEAAMVSEESDLARAIAQGDASVVAEVESIVRSQAEDYHDAAEEASRVEGYWETLRVDGRAIMTRRLMGGWILLKHTCLGSQCEGRPLLLDDKNNRHCVVCGGSGNGLDGVYALPSIAGHSERRPVSPPKVITTPKFDPRVGRVVDPKSDIGNVPTISYLDEISHDLGEHVMRTVWTGPSEIKVEDYQSKRDFVSKEIGKRMLKGWTLLQASCPQCTMPLMTDLDKRKEICVLCGVVGLGANSTRSIVSIATSKSNTTACSMNSRSVGYLSALIDRQLAANASKDVQSRMEHKKALVRELVMDETRKAAMQNQSKLHSPSQRRKSDAVSLSNNSSIESSRQCSREYFRIDLESRCAVKPAESVGQSTIPEWLSSSRGVKDASISPAWRRVRTSASGRVSIDPADSNTQASIELNSRGKENATKRVDPGLADQIEHVVSRVQREMSPTTLPVLSPSNKTRQVLRSDPPALQGYAVGRKQAVDADATYSIVSEVQEDDMCALAESPSSQSRADYASPLHVMRLDLPKNFNTSDEVSILQLIDTVKARDSLTVDTTSRRSGATRAEPSPGMSQLMVPGSKNSADYGSVAHSQHRKKANYTSFTTEMPFSTNNRFEYTGSGRFDAKSHHTRALASPGLPAANNFEHSDSPPGRYSSSEDDIEPPLDFVNPVAHKKKAYKSTVEMKKALRGTNSFLARQSSSAKSEGRKNQDDDAIIAERKMHGEEAALRVARSEDPEGGSDDHRGFLKSFLNCAPLEGSRLAPNSTRSGLSTSSAIRPRITPESVRHNLGSHRVSMSSSSGDIKMLRNKASESTKLSSLTPNTGTSSREVSGISSHDLQMSPAFSVDQITIPGSKRFSDNVHTGTLTADDAEEEDGCGLSTTHSDVISPRASSAKEDDGDEPLQLHEEDSVVMLSEPPTPVNLTMTACLPSSMNSHPKKHEFVVVGGPLDLTHVNEEDVYDVSGMHDEEYFEKEDDDDDDDVYDSEDVLGMSAIRDEDIFGSQYHANKHNHHMSDIASLGSTTLDAVLARIDATKRQLELAPSGDSAQLRELIENLAEAASDIEKEDHRDQKSNRSQTAAATPQQKSQFMCN